MPQAPAAAVTTTSEVSRPKAANKRTRTVNLFLSMRWSQMQDVLLDLSASLVIS
jgi:hypothetical protein